jgi:hypothetical protein
MYNPLTLSANIQRENITTFTQQKERKGGGEGGGNTSITYYPTK